MAAISQEAHGDFLSSFFDRAGGDLLKPVLITFSGIDGAGKSTQIEKLSKHLAQEGLCVRRLAFWDDVALFRQARAGFSRRVLQSNSGVGTPEHPVERRDKNAQMWPLLIGRGILYVLDLINLRRVVREEKRTAQGESFLIATFTINWLLCLWTTGWRKFTHVCCCASPRNPRFS